MDSVEKVTLVVDAVSEQETIVFVYAVMDEINHVLKIYMELV